MEENRVYILKDVVEELKCIDKKIDLIEKNLNGKMDSLIDLLRDIVTTNLRNTSTSTNTSEIVPENASVSEPELYYAIGEEFIFIKGKKTYQNKDKIKTSFNGVWNKEKFAWAFRKYENFEEKLKEVFPDIIEGQL